MGNFFSLIQSVNKTENENHDTNEVNEKWQSLLDYEAEIMKNLSKSETIHG